jgi:PAS domain S-box-containing protein
MNVREKTLFIFCITIILLISILALLSSTLILNTYVEIEQKNVEKTAYQTKSILEEELAGLNRTARDWACWDDTYRFVIDKDPEYVQANLLDTSFEDLHLNVIVIVDIQGNVVFSKAYNLQTRQAVPFPPDVAEHLRPARLVVSPENPALTPVGVVQTSNGPLLIASHRILSSERTGPSRGILLMGRYLDASEEEKLTDILQHPVVVYGIDDPQATALLTGTGSTAQNGTTIRTVPVGPDTIAGFVTVPDIYGNPAIILRTDLPREMFSQGQQSVFSLLMGIFGTGLIFSLVTLVMLERFVFTRVGALNLAVARIRDSGDLSIRLDLPGEDEFSGFAKSLNRMMDELEGAHENLRNSEKRYHAVVEDQTEFISRFLPDGTHVFVNEAYCRHFHKDRNEILGHRFVPQIPPEDQERVRRHISDLTIRHPVGTIEHRIVLPGGEIRWHQWTDRAIFDEKNRIIEYQSVGRDITGLKQIEEALIGANEQLRGIIEFLPDATFVIDKSRKIIAWNRAIELLTGVKKEEMIGKGEYAYAVPFYGETRPILIDLIGVPDPAIESRYDYVTRDGATLFAEVRLPAGPHRKDTWIWVKASPLLDQQGNTIGAIETVRDITDRKSVEEAYRIANEKLNLLTSITRHDLLNQLTALRGYVEIVKDEVHDEKVIRYLEKAGILTQSIQGLVQFTRDYQNIGIHSPQWQSLEEILTKTIGKFTPGQPAFDVALAGTDIYADPLLEKVFYNLIDNAVRHGQHVRRITVTQQPNPSGLVLNFADDGVGIPVHEKEKIFERGYGKNTGYGLFLIREILGITGMTIRETGEPGKGARFEILVPPGHFRITTLKQDTTGSGGTS